VAPVTASAVKAFPGSPATHIAPPSGLTGCSFLKLSIKRCCFLHFEQFSPFEHLCGFGMSCSMPTMDTDSRGVITSHFGRLRDSLRLGRSSVVQSSFKLSLPILEPCLDGNDGLENSVVLNSIHGEATSSIGVGGFGVLGALPLSTWISFHTFVRCPND
jgi:hypothetical protein